jgi:integrase
MRFDRRFKGVGRIRATSQTSNLAEFNRRDRILDRLFEAGQLEVLRMLKRGEISAVELRQAEREGRLTSDSLAADLALRRRLFDDEETGEKGAFTTTLPKMGRKDSSRARYGVAFNELAEITAGVLTQASAVADLARVAWKETLDAWDVAEATKNRLRGAVSAFLTQYLGDKYHPFRRSLMKAIPVYEEAELVVDLTVEEFWTLMEHVPEPAIASYVTLAASGLRVGEYLQCDEPDKRPQVFGIHIPGGKTGEDVVYVGAEYWPFVEQAIPCRIGKAPAVWVDVQHDARYKRLARWIRAASKATGITVTIHHLRHLYAQLGVAEMPEAMVQKALRHKTPAMTRRYSMRSDKGEVSRAVGRALKRRGA